jgi:poly-gamma-glutamate capsule biosynthesis protein CapA/YwtB (metallophosphatase superfamily)
MPFVPVVGFWSTESSISRDQLEDALTGESSRFPSILVPAGDEDAIAGALGVTLASNVRSGTAAEIRQAAADGALGLMRAIDVTPAVHALALDGVSLFGNERLATIAEWPLKATVDAPHAWDQAASWTLVAGGDILLDRGVARQVTNLGKGVDFPFDGGDARITRLRCCSQFGYEYPITQRTGNRGAMREMLSGADIAMANLESAVLENAPFHDHGFTFTGDVRLLTGIDNAGIDFLSLANNHIGNGGRRGITTAMDELDRLGIAHGGAGRDEAAASQPTYLEVNGFTLAMLPCDAIARGFWSRGEEVGSQGCQRDSLVEQIRNAAAAADVVVVFPHWGREYRARPVAYQRALAAEWVDAGADLVIGGHSHWAGGIEDIDGNLVFYSLGNFVFDQDFSQPTMMGVVLELTFAGDRLAQAWLHPTLILNQAQPNFADPLGDGEFVIDQMRAGSEGLLRY